MPAQWHWRPVETGVMESRSILSERQAGDDVILIAGEPEDGEEGFVVADLVLVNVDLFQSSG